MIYFKYNIGKELTKDDKQESNSAMEVVDAHGHGTLLVTSSICLCRNRVTDKQNSNWR
ncbi:MAG: hypothetical protein NT088_02825 [Candidatus Omnitrophica bacterium]|nr:hypothetical protein [Candidatus Omnitrophota bacterium]